MVNSNPIIAIAHFLPAYSNLSKLPWGFPPQTWQDSCPHLTDLPLGKSRHPVFFINCLGTLLAVKEMPAGDAQKEYQLLAHFESLRIPAVSPVGMVQLEPKETERSYLITKYLDRSLPYRTLFMSHTKQETQSHLLDAMANLLVQLHLAGIYWGDCSLSNTLFRRDAGALSAYLVDAESAEVHPPLLIPAKRFDDLQMMEENLVAEMLELAESGYSYTSEEIYDTGKSIRQRYHRLWEEIHIQAIISPDETYRIQERIRSVNTLGFSVRDVNLTPTAGGNMLRLKIAVAGRNFHRDQLLELTGLETEEMQARKIVNEINELKAILSQDRNEDIPIEAASYHWLQSIYTPVTKRLQDLIDQRRNNPTVIMDDEINRETRLKKTINLEISLLDPVELYCQVLEHKWYLSEQAKHDVGHMTAVDNFIKYMGNQDTLDLEP